jgi:hypothetical protein
MFGDILMKVSLPNFNWVLENIPCVDNKNRWRVSFQKRGNETSLEEIA